MAKFQIFGNIVDTDADRMTPEDVTPAQIAAVIEGLADGEGVELEVSSYGGSVPAGLAICNMLRAASAAGHRTSAHVVGIAASMASAISCACDDLKVDANAFLMVHNPFTVSMGESSDLRKDADTLDQMRDALVAIYRAKFNSPDDAIKAMMDAETWIIGAQAETFSLAAEVVPTEEPLRAAAFAGREMPKWLHVPEAIADLVRPPEPEPDTVTKDECEKRVSGMQSAMAKQMDAMKKDYEAKIEDFQNQLKLKDEELSKANAEATRLSGELESTKDVNAELTERSSALEAALAEKTEALAKLNAGVLTPSEELPTLKAGLAKCRTAKERVAFISSGKYTK